MSVVYIFCPLVEAFSMASTVHRSLTTASSTGEQMALQVIRSEINTISEANLILNSHPNLYNELCGTIRSLCWRLTSAEALTSLHAAGNGWLNALFQRYNYAVSDQVNARIWDSVDRLVYSLPATYFILTEFSQAWARKYLISDIFTPIFSMLKHRCPNATIPNVVDKINNLHAQIISPATIRELNGFQISTPDARRHLLLNYRTVAYKHNLTVAKIVEYVKVRNERNACCHFNESMNDHLTANPVQNPNVCRILNFAQAVGIANNIWKNNEPQCLQRAFQDWYLNIPRDI